MDALLKIKKAGFDVTLVDGFIEISPASRLTEQQLTFLKLHKAEIISELQAEKLRKSETFITCGDCLLFKCLNQHGGGAGLCLAGVKPSGASHWSETEHQCTQFDARVEWIFYDEPQGETVQCFTPAGDAIVIEAASPEHAAWLIKMNPKR